MSVTNSAWREFCEDQSDLERYARQEDVLPKEVTFNSTMIPASQIVDPPPARGPLTFEPEKAKPKGKAKGKSKAKPAKAKAKAKPTKAKAKPASKAPEPIPTEPPTPKFSKPKPPEKPPSSRPAMSGVNRGTVYERCWSKR